MKKFTLLFFLLASTIWCFSQTINSIRPNYAAKGTTLQTVITMPNGAFQSASPPQGSSDIYLQQGATLIYVNSFDPMINIYQSGVWPNPWTDSMFVDWSNFHRLTLVHKIRQERMTIDLNLILEIGRAHV